MTVYRFMIYSICDIQQGVRGQLCTHLKVKAPASVSMVLTSVSNKPDIREIITDSSVSMMQ